MTKKRKERGGGEHWTKMLRHSMQEPAWAALSTTAQAAYPWLKLEWKGPDANNNGRISLSCRQLGLRMGIGRDTAAEAMRDLQRKGWIAQTSPGCLGVEGAAKSPTYELTEIKMPGADGDGRKLYREWQPGKDFPVACASANNPRGHNGKKARHENRDAPVLKIMTNSARLS